MKQGEPALGLRVHRPQDIAVALVGHAEHAAPEHLTASSAKANVVCARAQRDRSELEPACLQVTRAGGCRGGAWAEDAGSIWRPGLTRRLPIRALANARSPPALPRK